MRRRAMLAIALATTAAAGATPATADAKGITSLAVCGTDGCHRVDPAAVETGFGEVGGVLPPDRPEPFYVLRARARGSNGHDADVFTLDWLPRSGLARYGGQREWLRPAAAFDNGLRRAARGLRPRPASALAIGPPAAQARVTEVFSPADRGPVSARDTGHVGGESTAIAGAVALLALGVAAVAVARIRRRSHARGPPRRAEGLPLALARHRHGGLRGGDPREDPARAAAGRRR
jgi:hypothetical protein